MEKNTRVLWATAKVIHDARNARGLSQTRLADFAGIARSFISGVERGNTGMSISTLLQVAEVLHVDGSELLRRIEEEGRRGPERPPKIIGRPRKTPKKEKAPESGNVRRRRRKKTAK